jgi:hypothetical protein
LPAHALEAVGHGGAPRRLGRVFDTLGRKILVTLCYLASALVAAILALRLLGSSRTEWTFIALVCGTSSSPPPARARPI